MTYDEAEQFPDKHSLRHALVEGSKNTDLDEAVLGIQAILGIRSGDAAACFFSGLDDDEWPQMDEFFRFEKLYAYALMELQCDLVGAFHQAQEEAEDDKPNACGGNCGSCAKKIWNFDQEPNAISDDDNDDGRCYVRGTD
jgi:hypothetical protein